MGSAKTNNKTKKPQPQPQFNWAKSINELN